jgi:integrase
MVSRITCNRYLTVRIRQVCVHPAFGVLRYRRQKSGELATVPLPERLMALLRDVPLERDSVGTSQPFRTKDTALNSDTRKWQHRLGKVFTLAGIKSVRTERGTDRKPHPHMLRDTFAVGHLKHGAQLRTVSKMLGHSKTGTTERAYLPWVKELEDGRTYCGCPHIPGTQHTKSCEGKQSGPHACKTIKPLNPKPR